jgi:hypothetical protein
MERRPTGTGAEIEDWSVPHEPDEPLFGLPVGLVAEEPFGMHGGPDGAVIDLEVELPDRFAVQVVGRPGAFRRSRCSTWSPALLGNDRSS